MCKKERFIRNVFYARKSVEGYDASGEKYNIFGLLYFKMMRQLYESLEQSFLQTNLNDWMNRVLFVVEHVDFSCPDTWSPLALLSKNVPAMCLLTQQIRRFNPVPPKQPREEAVFYMMASFCSNNQVLGYLIDTWLYYYRTKNNRGLLSCAYIHSLVNRHGEYPHLNVLYNLMMGQVMSEYYLYVAPSYRQMATTFLTDRDFHLFGKYLPDFMPFSFQERVQVAHNKIRGNTTGEELARECCMSVSMFRKRFKQEFGIPVSEWLRRQRKERIERMLLNTDLSLGQVAERNGFNMLSTFSDYCHRNFGLSPGQMRKKQSE